MIFLGGNKGKMLRKIFIGIFIVFAIFLVNRYFYSTVDKTEIQESNASYKKLTAEEAKEIIEGKQDFILLDVRRIEEYSENKIKEAISLPLAEIEDRANDVIVSKEVIILVYCYGGTRSKEACRKLLKLGYKAVYDIGGISVWPYLDMIE